MGKMADYPTVVYDSSAGKRRNSVHNVWCFLVIEKVTHHVIEALNGIR